MLRLYWPKETPPSILDGTEHPGGHRGAPKPSHPKQLVERFSQRLHEQD